MTMFSAQGSWKAEIRVLAGVGALKKNLLYPHSGYWLAVLVLKSLISCWLSLVPNLSSFEFLSPEKAYVILKAHVIRVRVISDNLLVFI